MPSKKNLEEGIYDYMISSINSSLHCDEILEKHNCLCSSFVPLVENDIGIYFFRKSLEDPVLEALKNAGCKVYQGI